MKRELVAAKNRLAVLRGQESALVVDLSRAFARKDSAERARDRYLKCPKWHGKADVKNAENLISKANLEIASFESALNSVRRQIAETEQRVSELRNKAENRSSGIPFSRKGGMKGPRLKMA